MDNLEKIKLLPLILGASTLSLDPEVEQKVGSKLFGLARSNAAKINVYRILYRSGRNKIMGYMIEPKILKKKIPCIIWNRGGSREFGSIKQGQLFIDLAEVTKQGYIVIASNYAGGPGSEGADDWGGDNLVDILNLYKILKEYAWADTTKIGMYGWSRGAAMTYMCLSKVRWIKAAVAGAGPTDEVSAPSFRKGWREHQINLYGESQKEQIKRSALYWAEKLPKKTPLLIMHGTADWRVNPLDSIRLAEKLLNQRIPFRLVMFEGGDHGLSEFKVEETKLTLEWFERFLKNNEPLPNTKPHGS